MNHLGAESTGIGSHHEDGDAVRTAPLVTVCIANFNGEDMIAGCIRSVLEQHDAPDMQVIVHDDASTDRSLEIIRGFPQVELLASPCNIGFCASNNRMVVHARGRYLLLLNNDAELLPDALRTLSEAAREEAHPGIRTLSQYEYHSRTLVDRGQMLDPFLNPIPNLDAGRIDVAMASGSCLWIPRALWEQIGGLPEYFENLAEDLYLCLYCRILGGSVRALNRSGYLHRIGASLGGGKAVGNRLSTGYRRRRASERNKTFCIVIFYPLPALLLVLPVHLFALLLEGLLLSVAMGSTRPLSQIYLPVFPALLQRIGSLYSQRRRVQSCRARGSPGFFAPFRCVPRKIVLMWRHGLPDIR